MTEDRAEITTELYCGNVCAIRSTHVVIKDTFGTWKVDGTIGPVMIS